MPDKKNEPIEEDSEVDIELSDENLVALSQKWLRESTTLYDELKRIRDINERYYLGLQTNMEKIPRHKCNAVENRIFINTETLVPILTENTPQFIGIPAQENEISERNANSVQAILKIIYESKNVSMKQKLKQAVRNTVIYRLGVLKPYWDESIDDVNIKSVRPQRIRIPKYGQTVDELPFVLEKVDMDYDEIKDTFGDAKYEEVKKLKGNEDDENVQISRVQTVWECWTNEILFWRCGDIILKKQKNPYFDFTGRKVETVDEGGNSVLQDVFLNHFRKPKKPYIFMSAFRLGNSVVGETDLIQQAIPMQDILNALDRQIVNNANKMGNSAWMIDSSIMTEEEARVKITNEEGLVIYGQDAAKPDMVRRESPPAMPNYIMEAKLNAQKAIDDIFGTHSVTRGERQSGNETLGGKMLLKQADIQRGSGTFVEEIDNAVSEAANWFVQLMKLYYEKEKTIKIYGESGIEFLKFLKTNIEDGMQVIVKEGSTLQQDELSKRNEAVILWQNQALDPVTLYERLRFFNPKETAERLVQWKMGKLMPSQGGIPPDMAMKGTANNFNPQQEMLNSKNSISQ
jgi:hypothetical protein